MKTVLTVIIVASLGLLGGCVAVPTRGGLVVAPAVPRLSTVSAMTSASRQSGKFHRKIIDQCRCSEIQPPSAGPTPPAEVKAMEKYM